MKRNQVAVRLGRSLATVRRLEGVLLYSRLDHRGVHRFDPDEVDALAADVEEGRVKLANELRPATRDLGRRGTCMRCDALERELADVRRNLHGQREANAHALRTLQRERDLDRAKLEGEAAALAAELRGILDTLDA